MNGSAPSSSKPARRGRLPRVAGRLPVHQGAGRAGPRRTMRRAPCPSAFVRPSIIESALSEPRPGWIRGFRMAEPIIISYARGLLREFPGVPEGIIDVIPVDMVVAAILAVAARDPARAAHASSTWPRGSATPALRAPGRAGPGLLRAQPALRRPGPTHLHAGVVLPGPRAGAATAAAGRHGHVGGGAGPDCLADPGKAGASWPPASRSATHWPNGPWGTSSSTAPTPRPMPATGSTTCSGCGMPADDEDHERFGFDPGVIDWDHYVLRDPLALGARARPRPHQAGQVGGGQAPGPRSAAPSSRPSGIWPCSISSTP